MMFTDLTEDLVPVYSSGYTGDEELAFDLLEDTDDEYDYFMPNETEIWL